MSEKTDAAETNPRTDETKDNTREVPLLYPRRRIEFALLGTFVGFLLVVLGAKPEFFGLDRSPVIGFIQTATFLIGLHFAEKGKGHIAAITSIAGTKGLGPAPSYSATKAMQNTYLQALEQQANARKLKIRFTDIRPGFVDTDLLKGDFHYPMMLKPEKVARQIVKAIHQKRHIKVIDWKYGIMTACWRRIPRPLWRHLKL